MQHIMIRIMIEDYEAWLKVHYEFTDVRRTYGITDGPVYRDIDNPNAALFHITVESLPRAMEWFQSQQFKEATVRAKVTGREFYLAEKRQQRCFQASACGVDFPTCQADQKPIP